MATRPAAVTLLAVVLAVCRPAAAQDGRVCMTMYEDDTCVTKRDSLSAGGRPKEATVCGTNNTCVLDDDYETESYQIVCSNASSGAGAIVYRWRNNDNCTGEAEEVALVGDDECVPLDTTSVKRLWAKAECDPEPEQTSTQAFEVALTMNIVITLVVFLLFALIFPHFNNVYQPRVRLAAKPPKPLPKNIFGFIARVVGISDEDMFQCVGMDALMYTRFFRWGLETFVFSFAVGISIVLPTNYFGSTGEESTATGLDRLSLSNVDSSASLWAHWVCAYLIFPFAMWRLHRLYKLYLVFRMRYLSAGQTVQHTVLVQDLPPVVCASSQSFKEAMEEMYDDVLSVTLCQNVKGIRKVCEEREAVQHKLEHAIIKNKTAKTRATCKTVDTHGIHNHDAEEYYTEELARLNQRYSEEKAAVMEHPEWYPCGFVTFSSVASAAKAAQVLTARNASEWSIIAAPEPREMQWDNLMMSYRTREIRSLLVLVATWALILLWVVPVTLVASLTTISALGKVLGQGFIDFIYSSPIIKGFLEGFLPTLALLIFMAILPLIMKTFARLAGVQSNSMISRSVLANLTLFYYINVFFVSIIAGSLLSGITQIIEQPTEIINMLGTSIPKTGTFFTTFVMLRSLTLFPLQLLRIGPLVVSTIKLKWLAITPRERKAARSPGAMDVGTTAPIDLLLVLVGCVYATVAPIITPFMIIFFGVGLITYKYLLFYVYMPAFEGGGQLFPVLFQRIMVACVVAQLTIIGVLGVKGGSIQAPLLIPLLVATVAFWVYCNRLYGPMGSNLPQRIAVHIAVSDDLPAEKYLQPELIEDDTLEPVLFADDDRESGPAIAAGRAKVASEDARSDYTPLLGESSSDEPSSGTAHVQTARD